ncbi:hypothetical protein LCGC14_2555320 [marine sediment metagenome]|uniref:Uncharacterized protein n=1 Tax=marine sediment metagenome TaxID=412755 RepID=A0A0F9CXV8_9ZZZZ
MPDGLPYEEMFVGPEAKAAGGGLGGLLARPEVKGAGTGIFLTWLLNKVLQTGHETGMRNIQKEGLRSQAEMVTPENLYFQAAQPQAQEEESMARQALFTQLSGGVLGPSLAKGEYMIGGQ